MEEKKITFTPHPAGCLICGKPLRYLDRSEYRTCSVCGGEFLSHSACEDGHYVCDGCHEADLAALLIPVLLASEEKDPQILLDTVMDLPAVHIHGPEHHAIVPCVLLTAYKNNGGEISLRAALTEALKRAAKVPGGVCGFWGACGASIGAGIYLSILTGSNPLHTAVWSYPQQLTARCLERNAEIGGNRCCKRTSRIAVDAAVKFTSEWLGIEIPSTHPVCRYMHLNAECLRSQCPFFPVKQTS